MMFEKFEVPIILVLLTVFLWDRFLRKMYDGRYVFLCLVILVTVLVLFGGVSGKEGFTLGGSSGFRMTGDRQMMAFEKTRGTSANFDIIVGPRGERFSERDWVVLCVGWRMNFSHWSDGHVARTFIRDGVWWYELRGFDGDYCGNYGGDRDKISFLAIPRSLCNVRYPWYQDSGCAQY